MFTFLLSICFSLYRFSLLAVFNGMNLSFTFNPLNDRINILIILY